MKTPSIRVAAFSEAGTLISEELCHSIISGCLKTLKKLGPLAQYVSEFDITFERFNYDEVGPCFKINFQSRFGEEGCYNVDYHSIRFTKPNLTRDEVMNVLMEFIPGMIERCLEQVTKRIELFQTDCDELPNKLPVA